MYMYNHVAPRAQQANAEQLWQLCTALRSFAGRDALFERRSTTHHWARLPVENVQLRIPHISRKRADLKGFHHKEPYSVLVQNVLGHSPQKSLHQGFPPPKSLF